MFSANGVYPDPEKVNLLEEADAPKNKDEVRSFLGMTNFSSIFIKDYSSITAELRKLLHKHTKWEWNEKHQQSFEILKNSLKDNCMLNYFDPNLKTEVICDASPYGLSAILFQHSQNENEKKVTAYASRSLTETE